MMRLLFIMSVGAFIATAFVAPDLFDKIRDDIRGVANGTYTRVQENLETSASN